ncbi:TPR domain/SEC-C motif domain-containing protein [Desulfuromonas sp. DDH964]|uniref:SEC-C metal-binding domain-containing protein n=1 Tax=Desulfuromonas sp. DDH964 TaxID=1823759 RepID=UPI00078B251E|nr:SEC-C metal-binding domain-containing protein [Desulfuromonas sp. DDH964]AMV71544.1 TPR domain/SEC-C motif domain-containing protein [Desulfuromonas sp. DDH964]
MEKVGRNDPCPCGSGQKFKKCCLGKEESFPSRAAAGGFADELKEMVDGRSFRSLKEAEAYIGWQMARKNRQGRAEFEGLSSEQMGKILYAPFDSPQLAIFPRELALEPEAPVMQLLDLLLDAIGDEGLKPTATGNLPRNLCRDIALSFHGEEGYREVTQYSGINIEPDFPELHVTRLVAEMAGLVRKYRGRFILGKTCRTLRATMGNRALYPVLFEAFVRRYEWGYQDRCPDFPFLQSSFLFSLLLLSRHGDQQRADSFYCERFLAAFPMLLEGIPANEYFTPQKLVGGCYSLRVLERFAEFFGLVEIERVGNRILPDLIRIRKRPLLDEVVKFRC